MIRPTPRAAVRREGAGDSLAGARILIVVNVDWFFLSHRLPIALAARDTGADVTVACADTGRGGDIEAAGLRHVALPFSRKGRNVFAEAATLVRLLRLYRALRPDVLHHVTIKPVLYGSIAARFGAREAGIVNAISGLGFSFSADSRARLLRPLVRVLYAVALRGRSTTTIFQNPEDRDRFQRLGLVLPGRSVLIRGSGVDCTRFAFAPPPDGPPVVLLASRLLWDKGVGDFAAVARLVRRQRPHVRFALAGDPDEGNPNSVPPDVLQAWVKEGIVEWWGRRDDMPRVLAQATLVTLPTYYPEGVPKVLLEAAAVGRALIATDVAGCREVVRDDVTGVLVRPHDPPALAAAITALLDDPDRRARLAAAARAAAVSEFAEEHVVAATLDVYRSRLP